MDRADLEDLSSMSRITRAPAERAS